MPELTMTRTRFNELASARYSVRDFTNQPVEQEKIDALLESARLAPTACNNQPQRIKVITANDDLAKVDACTPCRFDAPLVFLICYDKEEVWKRPFDGADSGDVDASIVTTHLTLAAKDLGLGSCWVMYFDPAKTVEQFKLPPSIVPVAYLPVGYPSTSSRPAAQHDQSISFNQMLI